MPQLDLESLFCGGGGGGGDSKVACETTLADSDADECHSNAHASDKSAPAESRRLRIGDDVDWAELAGAVLERDESTKGTSNPKSAAAHKGAPRSDLRRSLNMALKPPGKTAIIGVLPAAKITQQRHSGHFASGSRRAAAGARVFAREAVETEPTSPKVSCFGDVTRPERRAAPTVPPTEQSGRWASVTAALFCVNWRGLETGDPETTSTVVTVLSPPRPVALGDVKPLASRRWPEMVKQEERSSI